MPDIWPFPVPENIGLRLDVNDGLLVKQVRAGTPAAEAGIQPGDELLAMNGQPLVSQGDIQWVLHHLPLETRLSVQLRRSGETLLRDLSLSGNWRKTDVSWRDSLTGIRPGMYVRQISDGERRGKGIGEAGMALGVRYIPGRFPPGLSRWDHNWSARTRAEFRAEPPRSCSAAAKAASEQDRGEAVDDLQGRASSPVIRPPGRARWCDEHPSARAQAMALPYRSRKRFTS